MTKKARIDINKEITDFTIDGIVNGFSDDGTEWESPWELSGIYPRNAVTGKDYHGLNALIIMIIHGGGEFAGYGQWGKIKAQVKKGEKATRIRTPLFKKNDTDGKRDKLYGFGSGSIFSSHQVDGYDAPLPVTHDIPTIPALEEMVARLGIEIHWGGDKACFVPSQGYVNMPLIEQFKSVLQYAGTAIHEYAHWTGHRSRLDRILDTARYGDEAYAMEEMVAELTSAFVCAELGIHNGFRTDHVKYVKSWIKVLKNDTTAIVEASKQAARAADVLMGRRDVKGNPITVTTTEAEAVAA